MQHFFRLVQLLFSFGKLSFGVGLLGLEPLYAVFILRPCRLVLVKPRLILRPCVGKLCVCLVDDAAIADDRPIFHKLLKRLYIRFGIILIFIRVNIALSVDGNVDIGEVIDREAVGRQVDIAFDAAAAKGARAALEIYIQNGLRQADYGVLVIREGVHGLFGVLLRQLNGLADIVLGIHFWIGKALIAFFGHAAGLEVYEIYSLGYLLCGNDDGFIVTLIVKKICTYNALGVLNAVELQDLVNIILREAEGGHKAEIIKIRLVQISVVGLYKIRLGHAQADKEPRTKRNDGEYRHVSPEAALYLPYSQFCRLLVHLQFLTIQ